MKGCDQVVDALAEGTALDAALEAHVGQCADCQGMVAADQALAALTGAGPADEVLPPALRAALQRDARPVTARNPWRRAAPVVALAGGLTALVLVLRPRPDLAHQSIARFGLGLGAIVTGLAVALTLLLHGGRHGLGLPPRARWAFAAAALAGFEVINAVVTVPVEGSVHLGGAAASAARLGCALHGTLFAVLAGLLVFHSARRTAVVSPVTAGAMAGLAAGLVGVLTQHLGCPVMDLDHTLVAHIAPLVLGVLGGALAGRRWLAP